MLISLADWFSRNDDLSRPHRGVVIENDDPKKRRRIKVRITGLIQGLNLPWIYPKNPSFLGGGQGAIDFAIPEIGSEVIVEFPFKDIYFGFYTGHWGTKNEPKEFDSWSMDSFPFVEFDENYPDSYGFRDSNGNYFRVNKIKNTMEIYHKSSTSDETRITVRDDGQIDIFTLGDINQINAGDVNLTVGGSINVTVPALGAKVNFVGIAGVPLVAMEVSELGNVALAIPIGGVDILIAKEFALASLSVSIAAGVDVNISAAGKASVSALGDASITAGGKVDVTAGGEANITAGGLVIVQAGGAVDITAIGLVTVQAAAAMLLQSIVSIAVMAPLVLLGPGPPYSPVQTENGFAVGVSATY